MSDIFKTVAICVTCGKNMVCGEECQYCKYKQDANLSTTMAKYAQAMKEAINCWRQGECAEHEIPCQPTLKEFAIKIYDMQQQISTFKKAILTHKSTKNNPDEVDLLLWELLD